MVGSGLAFVGVNATVRALGTDLPAAQSAFIRYAFGVLFFLPMLPGLLRQGLPAASCLDPRQADSAQASASLWADQLQARMPFAAVLLGMGEDGHIASLFPGMPGLAPALDLQAAPGALSAQ